MPISPPPCNDPTCVTEVHVTNPEEIGGGISEPLSVDDNGGSLTVDTPQLPPNLHAGDGGLLVHVQNPSGGGGGGGGTEFEEDTPHVTGNFGPAILGVRNDAATARTSADGDYSVIATDAAGRVGITDLGGSVTVDGSVNVSNSSLTVTGPLTDDELRASPVPISDAGGSLTVDGTVAVSGTVGVSDGGGSLTVDGTVTANAGTGPWPVTDNGGTLSIDDGGASITVDGTFWQATQPVSGTVTADAGTGPWPVTDNGGSLTVDSTQLPAALDADGGLKVHVQNSSVGGGGTEFAEDSAHTTGALGSLIFGVRNDEWAELTSDDGDYSPISVNYQGQVHTVVANTVSTKQGVFTTTITNLTTAYNLSVAGYDTLILTVTGGDYSEYSFDTNVSNDGGASQFTIQGVRQGFSASSVYLPVESIFYSTSPVTRSWIFDVGGFTTFHLDGVSLTGTTAPTITITLAASSAPRIVVAQDGGESLTVDDGNGSLTVDFISLKTNDTPNNGGDYGNVILGVRNDLGGGMTSANGDYSFIATDAAGRVGIADLGGVISVDDNGGSLSVDGTVTVQDGGGSLTVDYPALKTEDIIHSSGDQGNFILGVRNDLAVNRTATDGVYSPISTDVAGRVGITDLGGSITVDGTVTANAGTGPWPVTDNGGSLTVDGAVTADTELPAAAALSDSLANPTTPVVGSAELFWDPINSVWRRRRPLNSAATGATPPSVSIGGVRDAGASATNAQASIVAVGDTSLNLGNGEALHVVGPMAIFNGSSVKKVEAPNIDSLSSDVVLPAATLAYDAVGGNWDRVGMDADGGLKVHVQNSASGGGGVQYTEGDTDTTITGTAMLFEAASDTLRVPSSTNPLPVSGTFWQATQPVSIAATVATRETRAGSATASSVTATTTSIGILGLDANRLGATIYNDSAASMYVLYGGGTASTTTFSIKIAPGGYLEVPFMFAGAISAIWDSATGAARVTTMSNAV